MAEVTLSNYPPGVTEMHEHFNPPICPSCKNEAAPGEDCEYCGEYVMDAYDEEIAEEQTKPCESRE